MVKPKAQLNGQAPMSREKAIRTIQGHFRRHLKRQARALQRGEKMIVDVSLCNTFNQDNAPHNFDGEDNVGLPKHLKLLLGYGPEDQKEYFANFRIDTILADALRPSSQDLDNKLVQSQRDTDFVIGILKNQRQINFHKRSPVIWKHLSQPSPDFFKSVVINASNLISHLLFQIGLKEREEAILARFLYQMSIPWIDIEPNGQNWIRNMIEEFKSVSLEKPSLIISGPWNGKESIQFRFWTLFTNLMSCGKLPKNFRSALHAFIIKYASKSTINLRQDALFLALPMPRLYPPCRLEHKANSFGCRPSMKLTFADGTTVNVNPGSYSLGSAIAAKALCQKFSDDDSVQPEGWTVKICYKELTVDVLGHNYIMDAFSALEVPSCWVTYNDILIDHINLIHGRDSFTSSPRVSGVQHFNVHRQERPKGGKLSRVVSNASSISRSPPTVRFPFRKFHVVFKLFM